MTHEQVTRDPMTVVGIEIRTSNDRAEEIGGHWQRFLGEGLAARIEGRLDEAVTAVYCEYEGDHTQPYTYLLGCRVAADAPVPDGMVRREIPGGTFARVLAEGEQPQALIQAWMGIWQAPIERRFEVDYEIHEGGERVEIFVGA